MIFVGRCASLPIATISVISTKWSFTRWLLMYLPVESE